MQVKYLDVLPTTCKDQSEGVVRALVVEDMLKHDTLFFATEVVDGDMKLAPLKGLADILWQVYDNPKMPIAIWNKSLEYKVGFFQFNDKNEKVMMLFDLDKNETFKNTALRHISEEAGEKMAKVCPEDGCYVLYLDCLECEDRAECNKEGKEEK